MVVGVLGFKADPDYGGHGLAERLKSEGLDQVVIDRFPTGKCTHGYLQFRFGNQVAHAAIEKDSAPAVKFMAFATFGSCQGSPHSFLLWLDATVVRFTERN